jgi:hypothetical protein
MSYPTLHSMVNSNEYIKTFACYPGDSDPRTPATIIVDSDHSVAYTEEMSRTSHEKIKLLTYKFESLGDFVKWMKINGVTLHPGIHLLANVLDMTQQSPVDIPSLKQIESK